jgi:hypothetical protein
MRGHAASNRYRFRAIVRQRAEQQVRTTVGIAHVRHCSNACAASSSALRSVSMRDFQYRPAVTEAPAEREAVPSSGQPANAVWQTLAMAAQRNGERRDLEMEAETIGHEIARDPQYRSALAAGPPRDGALSPGLMAFFAQRMGTDAAQVKLHTGAGAAAAAHAASADAFTIGSHIYFDAHRFAPESPAGGDLLAHEMVHVAQQQPRARATGGGDRHRAPAGRIAPTVQRRVAEKQTKGIALDVTELQKWQKSDYWTQKILGVYAASMPLTRFASNAEERDAVLSAAWTEHRALGTLSAPVVKIITLPKRSAGTKELAYRLEYAPAAKGATDPRPTLDIAFLAEGQAAVSVAPSTPATALSLPPSWREAGFPTGGLKAYAARHADEVNQLLGFVDSTKAGSAFTQVVETRTTKPPHATTFLVDGNKDASGTLTTLTVHLVAQRAPAAGTVPADYAKHDRADLELEKLQATKDDRLGTITGLTSVPEDEQLAVKFAIWQYFKAGKTRNAEVDAIVPLPDGKRRILYTLRFEPKTNDVAVERIGEEGKGATVLDPATRQFDVRRAHGFQPAFGTDAGALKTWLGARYPGLTPSGADAPKMIADANTKLNTQAGTASWFSKNYTMRVLDKAAAATRLQTVHNLDAAQTADMKDYQPGELRLVEWVLEMLSDALLALVKGISLVRQRIKIGKVVKPPAKRGDPPTVSYPTEAKTSGQAFLTGAERTLALYDNMTMGDDALFIGQAVAKADPSVAPLSAMTVAHELGHFVGWSGASTSVRAAFHAKFVAARAKLKTAPMTWYAASEPSTEFFPEAFAIYNADPEWMRTNLPDMFAWFEQLAKTGTPP